MSNQIPFERLLITLLELGDATSRNLEFAHSKDVHVSLGEETITEHNLLEIRRRHRGTTRIETFSKRKEAKNGADWEWHLIGRAYTLKLRIQAKRVQCDNKLRIKHTVKSSGKQQRDLLIEAAGTAGMKAMYCIYCTGLQRTFWTPVWSFGGLGWFETGCLLANACDVPEATTRLREIEKDCVPWHFLCLPRSLAREFASRISRDSETSSFGSAHDGATSMDDLGAQGWEAPSIDELNEPGRSRFDRTGVHPTEETDLVPLGEGAGYLDEKITQERTRLLEQGIRKWLVTDVRHGAGIRFDLEE